MSSRFKDEHNVFRTKVLGPMDAGGNTPHRLLTTTDKEGLPEYLADIEFVEGSLQLLFKKGSRLPVWVGPGFISLRDLSALAGVTPREARRHLAQGLLPGSVLTAHGWHVRQVIADRYCAARPWEHMTCRQRETA